jgi:hypothetical protein
MKSSANYSSKMQPATIATIAFAYFVIAVLALYFLNPAYSLIRSFAGNYDLASYEFLIASTFFSLGLGSIALAFGLYQGTAQSARSWIGLIFLGIWGAGMLIAGIFPANEGGSTVPHMTTVLIAGIFPVDVEAYPETVFSYFHVFAILGSLFSLTLGTILLSRRFKQDKNWHPIQRLAFILALVMLAASILFFSVYFFPALREYGSFNELGINYNELTFIYICAAIGLIWLLLVAARLRFIVVKSVFKYMG